MKTLSTMLRGNRFLIPGVSALWVLAIAAGIATTRAQEPGDGEPMSVADADCPYFGDLRDVSAAQEYANGVSHEATLYRLSRLTEDIVKQLPPQPEAAVTTADIGGPLVGGGRVPVGSRTSTYQTVDKSSTIDRNIFAGLEAAGIKPAAKSSDFEFIRRVSLDLTGRIPAPDRVLTFVSDQSPDKRAKLVEELLAKPEWLDKWSVYFGDLFKNSTRTAQSNRQPDGRDAFRTWIRDSLASGKPYDQMARELISARSNDATLEQGSFTQGALNFNVGGIVTGGPVQDIWDQQTANVADTFLGIGHLNCLLCHNGKGHLDPLSLWGSSTTRAQAWQMASLFSRTNTVTTANPATNRAFWTITNNTRYTTDYTLNTTTGNRPARQPATPQQNRVAPAYIFNGHKPAAGEDYRDFLAKEITTDIQFSRASVNYLWKEFFGLGLVDPVNQFDPARLDPDNPPPAPWTLQASYPRLLNELAAEFRDGGYDLKGVMREIVLSSAYQLSSRYEGQWDPTWESLYARKLVRRLWSEEVHDAVAQTSNILPSYTIRTNGVSFGPTPWAMQFPETDGTPDGNGGRVSTLLDSFLRGNRVETWRSDEGSLSQALGLMNNAYVVTRTKSSGTGANQSLVARLLPMTDDQLVSSLFLTVLSRYPTQPEMTLALANLKTGNRTQQAENLLWVLYNKVDFIYNY